MIEKYEQYLEQLNGFLKKFFDQQKPYIFCKEGCAICCETGEYPFSELEFQYAMLGYSNLRIEEKNIIKNKVEEIKKDKKNSTDKSFMHACPFLINKKCSIYEHRGIICRSYGLLSYHTNKSNEQKYNIPCCVDNGLNYSNVYDKEIKMISSKLWEKTGIETEPVSYNIGLKFLLDNTITQKLELKFGDSKALIDWFNTENL